MTAAELGSVLNGALDEYLTEHWRGKALAAALDQYAAENGLTGDELAALKSRFNDWLFGVMFAGCPELGELMTETVGKDVYDRARKSSG